MNQMKSGSENQIPKKSQTWVPPTERNEKNLPQIKKFGLLQSSRSPSRIKDQNFENQTSIVNFNITKLIEKKPQVDKMKKEHTRNNTDVGPAINCKMGTNE